MNLLEKLKQGNEVLKTLKNDHNCRALHQLETIHLLPFFETEGETSEELQDILKYIDWIFQSGQFLYDFQFKEVSLSVQQQPSFIASHGGKVWNSAVVLSRYLLDNTGMLLGKHALELGAGPGLVSLVASGMCQSVLATDHLPDILENITLNSKFNQCSNMTPCLLDWSDKYPSLPDLPFEIFLGSDIFYSQKTGRLVADCLLRLMQRHRGSFIGVSLKTREGLEEFVRTLQESSKVQFSLEDLPSRYFDDFDSDSMYQLITVHSN